MNADCPEGRDPWCHGFDYDALPEHVVEELRYCNHIGEFGECIDDLEDETDITGTEDMPDFGPLHETI